MKIEPRPVPAAPAIAAGRARHRHRRYFVAWLLERCIAAPRTGTAGPQATTRPH